MQRGIPKDTVTLTRLAGLQCEKSVKTLATDEERNPTIESFWWSKLISTPSPLKETGLLFRLRDITLGFELKNISPASEATKTVER